jgi:superfamily I DNA/RNA helicase/RecB family exonuclease
MRAPILLRPPAQAPLELDPDPAQERVVAWRGPGTCVVLASPGTGATTTLVSAVVARLAEVPASQVLVIARDRDAVRRMRRAIARGVPGGGLPTVTTFHGLAYSLVRRAAGPAPEQAVPRLLSGAEEDARIRDVLRGAIDDGDLPWPTDLLAATSTLGFANDLRAMLARARELDLSPERLTAVGVEADVPAWAALGRLAEIDAQVMALEGVIDYSGLLEMAIGAVDDWPGSLSSIYVDDFQEAGPLQRELLQALTGPETATLVMADPDIAAFGFRGGDRLGALRLAERPERGGSAGPPGHRGAEIHVLDRVHRGTVALRAAYDAARRQPALPGLPADVVRAYRHPDLSHLPAGAPDSVEVRAHDTWGDLAAWVADDLRRLHLGHGSAEPMTWQEMAVISRSTTHLESLRRALDIAGVPVTMSAADIPLPDEPAVATLLAAITAALHVDRLTPQGAVDIITGPLLGLDSVDVRRLARALRDRVRDAHPGQAVPAGTLLIRNLLADAMAGEIEVGEPGARVIELGRALASVRECARSGASPADVLWQAWSSGLPDEEGLAWPERLQRAALAGHGPSGHDLDAVRALFATAERLSDRYSGVVGIEGLLAALEGQRVAAERVTATASATPGVALLTAHLAVGRQWQHVVVVGAQEGVWPPALGGSSALRVPEWEAALDGPVKSDRGGFAAPPDPSDVATALRTAAAERMAQERRLFALAASRATSTLVVATVESDAEHRSRFVDDLGVETRARPGRPPRPLTLDGLVARLRSVAQDPDTSPALRQAAIERLAGLADAVDDAGAPLAPRADPGTWWGVAPLTPGLAPVRPPDRPIPLSGSGLATLSRCPLRWFLSRVVRAEGPRGNALAIGSLVHVLAERAARGDIAAEPDAMLAELDRVWPELPFDATWESLAERSEVAQALQRLCGYLRTADPAVAVEHDFAVTIEIPGLLSAEEPGLWADRHAESGASETAVRVRGAIDRIEITADGRVRLIDFKTARNLPSAREVDGDHQLGIYQLAVRHGALADVVGEPDLAGAALVQLRSETKGAPGQPRIQEQPALVDDGPEWLLGDIADAVARVRSEDFPAVVSQECRTCPYAAACPAQPDGREVLT